MERFPFPTGILGLFAFVLFGCAGPEKTAALPAGGGPHEIALKASSFDFEPARIVARRGDVLWFSVENISGTEHNLTVKDPAGRVVRSVPLPPKQTTTVEVPVPEAGDYPFYCDKPMHPTLGMKGKIEVVP